GADRQLRRRLSDIHRHAEGLTVSRAGARRNAHYGNGSLQETGLERQCLRIQIDTDGAGGALSRIGSASGHVEPRSWWIHTDRVIEELRGHARAHGNVGSGWQTSSAQLERKRERV